MMFTILERTTNRWKTTFQANGEFPVLRLGKYERSSVIYDEVWREAVAWARENANVKEMPNILSKTLVP